MSMTIYDIQRMKTTDFEKGIVDVFQRESDPIKLLPINEIGTTSISTRRQNSLPTVTFRQRGARFSDGGMPGFETVTDAVYNIGAEVTIDEADMMDKGPYIVNPLQYNVEMKLKAISYKLNDYIINGDQASDPDGFDGLAVRIAALASTQTVYGTSDGTSSGTHTDTDAASQSIATANTFLNFIQDAIYAVDGHKADVCFTDGDWIRALKRSLRYLGLYNGPQSPDKPSTIIGQRDTNNVPLAGPFFEWEGVKFIDMGVKGDQTTKIVATETIDSAACRPAFFTRIGGDYLSLIQMGGALNTKEPFPLDDGVSFRTVISWYLGMRHVHPRFATKLTGIKVA